MYPPFILWKGFNQNPRWYTRDYSKQLTNISRSMPISSKQTIKYLRKTCLISLKTSFDHSSSFNLPLIYLHIFFPSNPELSRGIWVGQLHLVCILIQSWIDLIYSPPISNRPWRHPVGWLHTVYFWFNYTFSPSIFIWTRSHPFTLQFLKLHPDIITLQKSPMQSYCLYVDDS